MKRFITFSIILATLGLLSACNGSKALTKKGSKLEAAGLMDEAANFYYNALRKNRSNVDAQIGMRNAGQVVLNELLSEFSKSKNFGSKKEAVYAYMNAIKYQDKIAGIGVKLPVSDLYQTDFENVKTLYLNELYEDGSKLLEEENFADAEKIFAEISNLQPDFKDTGTLKEMAYLEPRYNRGKTALENGQFRTAYHSLDEVIKRKADYKDAAELKKQSVENGRFAIALMPFENGSGKSGMDAKVSAYVMEALLDINDPFLKIVDRANLEMILEEQKLGLTGVIDEETAVNVGEILGAQALLSGTVIGYSEKRGKLWNNSKTGYEQYQVKHYNPDTEETTYETKYRSKTYKEYGQINTASVTFQFRITSLSTGEVMFSEMIEKDVRDEIHYVKYDGNAKKLYPGAQGGVELNKTAYRELQNLMKERTEITGVEELGKEVMRRLSADITASVEEMLKSKIQ